MIEAATFAVLLPWFYQVREPYFFRQERNPYRVWVSEVALQQTRIQAALTPLTQFLSRFPDVQNLAGAREEEVLQAFRGLGYYARARNLHKAAQTIVVRYGGQLPQTYSALCRIPSIGPYTAAAISSICYGERKPVLDGNVKRILARTQMWDSLPTSQKFCASASRLLEPLFLATSYPPGDMNEALMELGQKICLRANPACQNCCITPWCEALARNQVSSYPLAAPKAQHISVIWHLYFLVTGDTPQRKVLMQRWADFYFLKNQLAFPSVLEFPTTKQLLCSWPTAACTHPEQMSAELGSQFTSLTRVSHTITKHRVQIQPYLGKADFSERYRENGFVWVPEGQVSQLLVASALTKAWQQYLRAENL